ncbi:FAS1-like dehydratase domain-containing protein [Amycolatopsis thermophila]|uniref:Acyl dehydratase n=1 Tax=Amycolatopsis thermophila TaxID=206084 RepID=A0ABU0F5C1_9PSEU|nr:MaoC family dehydratase N-terminal domain-containing protein [Amycolatopsis thermophila]MDQ0382751.1 acyl dehydratase [Amycolatopsis thermophila]
MSTSPATEASQQPDRIREEDITRAKDLVGFYYATTQREHFATATPDVLRNFARGYGDDNPLYTDAEYGAGTRWGAQIAAPMTGVAVNEALRADPLPADRRRPSFRGIHVFVSGSSWEWFRPVFPGDRLHTFQGFENVEVKASEFAGRSVIITRRHVRMNQRGEVVSIARVIAIHTDREKAKKTGKYDEIKPATYTPEDIAEIDEIYAAEGPRGDKPRYWEDVHVGDSLGKMVKGPLTGTDLILFHAGGYGFTPYAPSAARLGYQNRKRIPAFYVNNAQGVPDVVQRVHWDTEWAQSIGVPMAYDYGVLRDCWLSHYLTDWMGDDAWLLRQSSQMRKFNYIGDTHIFTGEIVGKRQDGPRRVVDVELRGTSQRGEVTCPATATIALPSRDAGPVPLPQVPEDIARTATEIYTRHNQLGRAH